MTFVVALLACLAIGVVVGAAVGALVNYLAAMYMRARRRADVDSALAPYDLLVKNQLLAELEAERGLIDAAERSVVRYEHAVPRWRYCCASDGMRLLCQYLDRSPAPCEAFATDHGILPYCPHHRVEALAEVVWVPSPWVRVK